MRGHASVTAGAALGFACLATLVRADGPAGPAADVPPTIVDHAPPLEGPLAPFYEKLTRLVAGTLNRVTIVHVGDSHVQGELLTSPLRRTLQDRYGAAGRGLVLPAEVAGTNGPTDLVAVSDAEWNLSRLPAPDPEAPPGAAGMTITTTDGGFLLKLAIRGAGSADRFDRVTLLAQGGPGWTTIEAADHPDPLVLESSRPVARDIRHTVRKGDTLYALGRRWGCTPDQLRKWNRLPSTLIRTGQSLVVRRVTGRRVSANRNGFRSLARFDRPAEPGPYNATVDLPRPTGHVFLRGSGTGTGSAMIYGILLDRRDARGIDYHAAGVNGAEFRDFTGAALLWRQVEALKPDLLIVTLGTNDLLAAGFSTKKFRAQVTAFLDRAAATLGPVPILIMGPPDVRGPRGREIPALSDARDTLRSLAADRRTGFWDTAAAMLSDGGSPAWRKRRWSNADLVHLSAEGYRRIAHRLLADLLPGSPAAAAALR